MYIQVKGSVCCGLIQVQKTTHLPHTAMVGLKVNKFATYFLHYMIKTSTKIEQELQSPPYLKMSSSIDGGLGEWSVVH